MEECADPSRPTICVTEQEIQERLKDYLRKSLKSLQQEGDESVAEMTEEKIHELMMLIYDSMATSSRCYHGPNHVLEVLQNYHKECSSDDTQPEQLKKEDPVSILAILFHDVIYLSLDRELSPPQSALLKDVVSEKEVSKHLDPLVSMVVTVFGLKEEGPLPEFGKNEFLSAWLGIRALRHYLTKPQLLQLAVGIEATIPFRPIDKETGITPMECLYDKALFAYCNFISTDVALAESAVSHAVQQAVIVANSDLGAFSDSDPTTFIDSNWRLFPEWFPSLLHENCPLTEFRTALATVRTRKMDSAKIFLSFRGYPSANVLGQKRQYATSNLAFLRKYLSIRLLAVTMILDLISLTSTEVSSVLLSSLVSIENVMGGSVFMSSATEGPNDGDGASTWDDNAPMGTLLFQVLEHGRRENYSWDASRSLLSAALFSALGGSEGVTRALDDHMESLDRNVGTFWLQRLPKSIILGTLEALTFELPEKEAVKLSELVTDLGLGPTT